MEDDRLYSIFPLYRRGRVCQVMRRDQETKSESTVRFLFYVVNAAKKRQKAGHEPSWAGNAELRGLSRGTSWLIFEVHEVSRFALEAPREWPGNTLGTPWERRTLVRHVLGFFWERQLFKLAWFLFYNEKNTTHATLKCGVPKGPYRSRNRTLVAHRI